MWSVSLQEDMNLNEERKAPLRDKDLTTKREMVVQYISATAKSVSSPLSKTHESKKLSFMSVTLFKLKTFNVFVWIYFLRVVEKEISILTNILLNACSCV